MLRLITLISALLFAQAAAALQLYVDSPGDGFLNLRYGPSTAHGVVTEMAHGSPVKVLATPGKWFKVKDAAGNVGWAHRNYMTHYPVQPLNTPILFVNAPKHGALNLRKGPGTAHYVITQMPHGSQVKVIGVKGSWTLVQHQSGAKGWAHGGYLSETHYAVMYSSKNIQKATQLCANAPAHTLETCLAFSLKQLDW